MTTHNRSGAARKMPLADNTASVTVVCALCERDVRRANKHHIVPKSEGGTTTVWLCLTCHRTLHHFFTNATLASEKNSVDSLRADPDVARYLAWVKNKPDRHFQVRRRRKRY